MLGLLDGKQASNQVLPSRLLELLGDLYNVNPDSFDYTQWDMFCKLRQSGISFANYPEILHFWIARERSYYRTWNFMSHELLEAKEERRINRYFRFEVLTEEREVVFEVTKRVENVSWENLQKEINSMIPSIVIPNGEYFVEIYEPRPSYTLESDSGYRVFQGTILVEGIIFATNATNNYLL